MQDDILYQSDNGPMATSGRHVSSLCHRACGTAKITTTFSLIDFDFDYIIIFTFRSGYIWKLKRFFMLLLNDLK